MQIEVRLFATLRTLAPPDAVAGAFTTTVPEGCTVLALLNLLAIDPLAVHILMVNGVISEVTKVLNDGDRVGLFPAVGGG